MSIPSHILDQINAQTDLVALIGRHAKLSPSGGKFKACCPFHKEKTPSFWVDPSKNLYHCFGCGASGNAITFLREYENLSFIEAVKELAQSANIDLPKQNFTPNEKFTYQRKPNQAPAQAPTNAAQNSTSSGHTDHMPPDWGDVPLSAYADDDRAPFVATTFDSATFANDVPPWASPPDHIDHAADPNANSGVNDNINNQQGDLYTLLAIVNQFFRTTLQHTPHALAYFAKRGVNAAMIERFELGFAPDDWRYLDRFAFDTEGLRILGLLKKSTKGHDYPLFKNRIIFPIKDKSGKIVGFAGRAMGDDEMPKYLNSPASPVFEKNQLLYGEFESNNCRPRPKTWLLVEGYLDVIALYQAGIYGAVAPMGTAVGEVQLKKLLHYRDYFTLCLDGDAAGQKAARRTLELALPLLTGAKKIKFLTLPDGHDPDSFVQENGAAAFVQMQNEAQELSEFLSQHYAQKFDLCIAEQKGEAAADLEQLLALLPKGNTARPYIRQSVKSALYHFGRQKFAPAVRHALPTERLTSDLLMAVLYAPHLLETDALGALYQQTGLADYAQQTNTNLPQLADFEPFIGNIAAAYQLLNRNNALNALSVEGRSHALIYAQEDRQHEELLARWTRFYAERQNLAMVEILFNQTLAMLVKNWLINNKNAAIFSGLRGSKIYTKLFSGVREWERRYIAA